MERIHQIQLTEEYENVLKEQLKDRLDKYTKFFKRNEVLLNEFLIIKNNIEIQKILAEIEMKNVKELKKRSLVRSICVAVEPHAAMKLHKDNQKVDKTRKCNIFEVLNKIPIVYSAKRQIKGNTCMKMMTTRNTNNKRKSLKEMDRHMTDNKNSLIRLPEYFYFKKFNNKEIDKIYKR